jgi:hypothetical protein
MTTLIHTVGDFTTGPTFLTFAPGTTADSFTIPIVDDNIIENTENFFLTLSIGSDLGRISTAQGMATGFIVDDSKAWYNVYNTLWNS